MAVLALALFAAFLLLAGVARVFIQWRRTGDTGSFLVGVAAPVAEVLGLHAVSILDRPGLRAAGAVLAVLGIGAVIGAQNAMGASLRDDVDPTERTALITRGPFRIVRNPIYTAALAWAIGLPLLIRNPWLCPAPSCSGSAWNCRSEVWKSPTCAASTAPPTSSTARVGRFLPGIGRLSC